MDIITARQNEIMIVKINGRLDSNTAGTLEKKLIELMSEGETIIVVDFSELDYISSAGLRVLLTTAKKMKNTNGKLRICAMKDFIKEIFDISGFSSILQIDKTLEESLSVLNNSH